MLIKAYELNNQKIIIVDEITYLKNWDKDLKIYGDLYKIDSLTFAEYLFIKHNISIDVSDKLKQIIINTKNMKEKYDQLLDLSLSLPANLDNYYEEFKYRQFPFTL